MSSKRKIIIAIALTLCIAALGIGGFLLLREYHKYDVDFALEDRLEEGEGRPARVIILAGQSNAAGCSRDDCLKEKVSAEQYGEYSAGYDNVYINYYCSGTNCSDGFVSCRALQGEAGGFFGPELGLAEKLSESYPDEIIFIIKFAWCGTSLYDQWLSPSSNGDVGKLYSALLDFAEMNMAYLLDKGYDAKIEGICWMQGESDADTEEHAEDYEMNLYNFIGDLRLELDGYASEDGIAFVDALIAESPDLWVHYDLVNASKLSVSSRSPMNALIDTNAEGLVCSEEPEDEPDRMHYDALSEIRLGHLFAEKISLFFD